MPSLPDNDTDVYIVVEDFGVNGRSFLETDFAQAHRNTIVRNFISGQYENALRVVSFNTAEGWSCDVSEDIASEIIDRSYDADETLTKGAKLFINRHIDLERRPRALSVLREQDQVARGKA